MSRFKKLKVAVAQIQSTPDAYLNLSLAQDFHSMAQDRGAELLCFPENLFYRGPKVTSYGSRAETVLERDEKGRLLETSPFSKTLLDFLSNISFPLSLGSVLEKSHIDAKPFNAHWIVFPGGHIESYRKIHLFDFSSQSGMYRESEEYCAGSEPKVVEIGEWRLGLGICYDLRFAELFRRLVLHHKAEILLIPAAFTRMTGEAHWHTLLRARAIENLSFVLASGQWGEHEDSRGQKLYCFGHSLIVDPWGQILEEAPAEGDALLIHELSSEQLNLRREQLPALQSAKLFQGI